MTVLDYALCGMEAGMCFDEGGNLYIEPLKNDFMFPQYHIGKEAAFISREDCDRHREYEMIIPDGFVYDNIARRPYFRMRGKPVTQGQAFEIIRRTNHFFQGIDAIFHHDDYIFCPNFRSGITREGCYGWIHADGTIGVNSITTKYPSLDELIAESYALLCAFPYLDFVAAFTWWNEVPPPPDWADEHMERWWGIFQCLAYDEEFYQAVVLGIHVHEKKIEILQPKDAVSQYKKYASLYEKDRAVYLSGYCEKNGAIYVDETYLRRCIASYGLDADAAFFADFCRV